ncbi:MAG: DUF4258 domain-containing protein [Acidimicrobiia bacterium]|nr:DUF4258 domain-containing protein [Acidimicrobiia bacterium]
MQRYRQLYDRHHHQHRRRGCLLALALQRIFQNPMLLTYTLHARHVMEERYISSEWVERAVATPERRTRDPHDESVERFYIRVPERDGRVLRVAVNTDADPWRVVSAFFDRSMRGEL